MNTSRDAEINSSPTSSFDAEEEAEQDLFPNSESIVDAEPAVHGAYTHLNATAPGELSPPRSQGSEEPEGLPTSRTQEMHGEGNGNGHVMEYREERMDGNEGQPQGPAKPGSGWNNKRATEEYQRAWETVLDKDFSLREFGDVMAIEQPPPQGQEAMMSR